MPLITKPSYQIVKDSTVANIMKSITFILISVISGVIAGLVLAGMNMIVVEPIIDSAIEIETSNALTAGEKIDIKELNLMRL